MCSPVQNLKTDELRFGLPILDGKRAGADQSNWSGRPRRGILPETSGELAVSSPLGKPVPAF